MTAAIELLLAEDHTLLRESLAKMLAAEPDINIVGLAEDGLSCVKLAREHRPRLVLMDVSMPGLGGIEATRRITSELPGTRVLCLSMHDAHGMVSDAIAAGASGYVLKTCGFDTLKRAILAIDRNHAYLSPKIAHVLIEDYRQHRATSLEHVRVVRLTPREREIVQLLAEGYGTREIAERLHVSQKTVATHRENIMSKLHLGGVAELTRYALQEGLTTLENGYRAGGPPLRR
ncbi:response regulator transcription factor [Luteimonas sp. SJ-92]|uniref:Response regulator transcription factor n=1 Tax=Luteimonas salinisoli TaxID=2752307 RepID=A0A853JB79_9GAMM|nr:response regulator transcription factor [Luteimonas salinisoli]NZA26496.1 response regulator transcription factor [Luteimonas salinisoli]